MTARSLMVPETARCPISPPGKIIGSTRNESVVNTRFLLFPIGIVAESLS